MAEQLRQRPDSEEERVLWFASLAPNQSDLNFEDFKVGLQATEEIFATIQELITQVYDNHGLDNAALSPAGPDFRDAVTEATAALLAIFQHVPTHWMNDWCEALILDIWNKNRTKKEEIRQGKKPSPTLPDSPTTGKENPLFSNPPPPHPAPTNPAEQKKQEPLPIYQRTFALEVISSDRTQLKALSPEILEIISVICVPEGQDARLVKNYQLNLFIKEFEDILNAENHEELYNLVHGKLVYFYGGPGNRVLGYGRGTRRLIATQKQFEVAVAHLLKTTDGDRLTFTFFEENSQEKRKRLVVEAKAEEVAKQKAAKEAEKVELLKIKQRQEKEKAQDAREKREAATIKAQARSKAQAPPVSQRDPGRKADGKKIEPGVLSHPAFGEILLPDGTLVPRRKGTGGTTMQALPASASSYWANAMKRDKKKVEPGETAGPSGRKPVPEQVRVPKSGQKSNLNTQLLDPSPTSLVEPVTKSTPPRKPPPEWIRDVTPKARPSRPYPPPSSPSTIDKVRLKPEYGSVLYPGASTPPPIRRKRAAINALVTTVNTGKKIHAAMTGTSTHPKNAALFTPDPNKKKKKKEEKVWWAKESNPSTPRVSQEQARIRQEQARIRQEAGFHPHPPSPAINRRDSIISRVSRRASISVPSLSGIKNLFKRESKDVTPPAPAQVDAIEDFYAELSRRTFTRGGENEQELSIERLKEIGDIERQDDTEVEELEQPDDFENPDEYLVTRLQAFLNMKELSQIRPSVDSARWVDCCCTFQISPHEIGLNETVALAGLKTPLYQYQAYGVYWQMKTSRQVGGGFVADEMGLGKSLSFLAYMVAERQLSWLWEEVEATRENLGGRHLNEMEHAQGDRCPSRHERPGWIACPCASSSPTSKWPAKAGVRLVCVPQSLILPWCSQWSAHIDETEENLAMKMVIAHDAANPVPAPSFGNRDARHARNIKELSAKRQIFDSRASKYHEENARRHQDRYLVLTTPHSYKTWVKKFEYEGFFLSYAKSIENPTWVKGKSRGIVFGLAMIDECHEDYIKEKGRSGVLSDLPLTNNPFIWGYSGTPLVNTPRSIEGVLWAIEQHFPRKNQHSKFTGWDEDPILSQYHYRALDIICKDFEKHVKHRTGDQLVGQKLEDDFTPFLFRFMIRRTADSTWFGRPLIKLKKHIHQDVVLAHNPKFDDKLADLVKVIEDETHEKYVDLIETWKVNDPFYQTVNWPKSPTFNQRCRVEWRLRIIASFPFLVTLSSVHHKHHLSLTTEEVLKYKGTEVYKSPYSLYLKQIVGSSPKCIWLKQYILELLNTTDIDAKDQKLVIMTQFNPVALILKLFIERFVLPKDKKNRVGLICAGMKSRDRAAVLDAFTDAIDKDSGHRKQKSNIQILVGTTRLLGTGLQLTRAANLVLMEPDYELYRELQAVARIHRIGQRNPRSYSFRLINEGSEIETRIVQRGEQRGEVHGREVQTRLLSEFIAEQQKDETNNGEEPMPVDNQVREQWVQEHEELLEQFPTPPARSSSTPEISEGSTHWTTFVEGANRMDDDELYDAEVGR